MKNKPVSIKEVVEGFIKEYKPKKKSAQLKLLEVWSDIMPKQAQNYAQPVIIKNKTLIVTVSNSAWLHQLTIKKNGILKKVKHYLGNDEVDDIRFKIGKTDAPDRARIEKHLL